MTGIGERRARRHARVAVLLVHIDHFKALNDTHGHSAGDGILRLFASTAQHGELRRGDIIARQGGDEFVIVGRGRLTAAIAARQP